MEMIQVRAAHQMDDEFIAEDNERIYFADFPWHPGRINPSTPNQRGYLGQILPSRDTLTAEYVSNVIPGR